MKARLSVPAVLVLVVLLGSALPVSAQGLRLPTSIAATAAAADWASTYYALTHAHVREVNPVLRPFDRRPVKLVLLGAAIDVAAVWTWNSSMGRSRPRLAISGLWAMAAFRTFLAVHNVNNGRRFPKSRPPGGSFAHAPALTRSAPLPVIMIPPLSEQ